MVLNDQLPEILYKYRSWDKERHRNEFIHEFVSFVSPRRFNDPFDCVIIPDYMEKPNEDILKRGFEMLRGHEGEYPPENVKNFIDAHSGNDKEKKQEFWSEAIRRRIESIYDSVGIFSLSSIPDNILMWSHYANNHWGFCVGYNTVILKNNFEKKIFSDNLAITALQVNYCSEYPDINFEDENVENWIHNQYGTKAENWKYENEFRFIMLKKPGTQLYIPSQAISEVIFGHWMKEEHKNQIRQVIKEKGWSVKLFQAKTKDQSFGLDILPID